MEAKKAMSKASIGRVDMKARSYDTRLTGSLNGCNEQVARQQLCQSVLETDFAGKGFLQEADEDMTEWCGHEEAVQGHFERSGVDMRACERFGER